MKREFLWVDSLYFVDRANALLTKALFFSEEEYGEAQTLLKLYQDPFLSNFPAYSSDNREYIAWRHSRRTELAAIQHDLLDRMTTYCLRQAGRLAEAQNLATLWLQSEGSNLKPLQILIGLALYMRSDSVNTYLEQLRQRQSTGQAPMGRSWEEWQRLIKRNSSVSPSALFPLTTPLSPTTTNTERKEVLEEVLTVLTSSRERQVFGLSGLPGSGKSEMARKAAQLLLERKPDTVIAQLKLPTQLDFEMVANQLLIELQRQDLLNLDYGSKRKRLKQILQRPQLVVIVDEGYSTHLANSETLTAVLDLLECAHTIMFVARTLPEFNLYEVQLPGFDAEQTRSFLTQRLGWLHESEQQLLQELAALTAGLPLMLNIILSGLKSQRGRVAGLIHHLREFEEAAGPSPTIFQRYEQVLEWLWQYLTTPEKNILFAIGLFAPDAGVTVASLEEVLGKITEIHIPSRLRSLVEMRLIEQLDSPAPETRYALHPIVLSFIEKRNPTVNHFTRLIQHAFVRYHLDVVRTSYQQFERLDEFQQNILLMFEMVVFTDQFPTLQAQAVELLHQAYAYFEQRGLYAKVYTLLVYVHEHFKLAPTLQVQTLFYIGKLAKFQGKFARALEALQLAFEIAQRVEMSERYASLHYNLGDLYTQTGKHDDALYHLGAADKWAKAHPHKLLQYSIRSNIARYYLSLGELETALEYAHELSTELGDDYASLDDNLKGIAQHNQNVLGLLLFETGNYDEAQAYFQRALELGNAINNPESTGYAYLNLGVTYLERRDFTAATGCFAQAKAIAERLNQPALVANVMANLGTLISMRDLSYEAFQLFRSALILIDDNQLESIRPRVLTAMGIAYLRQENVVMAQSCFKQVLLLPQPSLNYSARALCGLVLSRLMEIHLIGSNDVDAALQAVRSTVGTLPLGSMPLFSFPAGTILRAVERAEAALQRELRRLPEISRYQITKALSVWLSQ
ncbi:MAG: tetratricopeptide repeat protein [Chloroflexi bacterium]|uniref:tetratricopeptide repeat protein n=1 Tax=Candidatus Flexifilum breve TaxID=3140694 RepID=UPI00313480DC|nr:tetratricopeptide repeat protein [Chloroflexota bacterium]